MIQQLKIKEISINDKRILAEALNEYGQEMQNQYLRNTDERDKLLLFSICQNAYHELTQLFNSSKILTMPTEVKKLKTRKQTLLTHTALVAVSALQYYQSDTDEAYIKSRCDVLWNKIENQLI